MTMAAFADDLAEAAVDERRRIPFDYAFRYDLKGQPSLVHRRTVTVSIEASFVTVSIGYGVVSSDEPVRFAPRSAGTPVPVVATVKNFRSIDFGHVIDGLGVALGETPVGSTVGPQTFAVLTNGFRINRALFTIAADGSATLDTASLAQVFEAVAAPAEEIQFKYALFDDASGREFQSEPILNIAGLGISNGDRPFRYLAKPITFEPQSRIRMEVTEVSRFRGELHVSLQGYKVLGGAGTPTGRARRLARRATR